MDRLADLDPPDGFHQLDLSRDSFGALAGPFFARLSSSAEVGVSPLRLGFRVMPKHANPGGFCHGGMLMTAMDLALGQAVLHVAPDPGFTPTVTMGHDFLSAAKVGDWLESRVDLVHTTRRSGFANGVLIGPSGPVLRSNALFRLSARAGAVSL